MNRVREQAAVMRHSPQAGRQGVAVQPPPYGIEFVDRSQAVNDMEPDGRPRGRLPPLSPTALIQRLHRSLQTLTPGEVRQLFTQPPDGQHRLHLAATTGLPAQLQSSLEALSGFPLDDVQVYYHSSKPAKLQALAYTQGTAIHVGPGQEHHLPHEAWHVVQQMQGRVQPTQLLQEGVSVNEDQGLEQEANVMGAKALQMRRPVQLATGPSAHATTAEQRTGETTEASDVQGARSDTSGEKGRLNFLYAGEAAQLKRELEKVESLHPNPHPPLPIQRNPTSPQPTHILPNQPNTVVQRYVKTYGGTFNTNSYKAYYQENVGEKQETGVGADIKLTFSPNEAVSKRAKLIGLAQTVKALKYSKEYEGQVPFTPEDSPIKKAFKLTKEEGDLGRGIDVKDRFDEDSETNTNPLYGVFNDQDVSTKLSDTKPQRGFGVQWKSDLKDAPAELYDNPRAALDYPDQAMSMSFEVTALVLEGLLKGSYLGSIEWGWEKPGGKGKETKLKPTEITKLTDGVPTDQFLAAAYKWNTYNQGKRPSKSKDRTLDVVKLPIPKIRERLQGQAATPVEQLAAMKMLDEALTREEESEQNDVDMKNLTVVADGLAEEIREKFREEELTKMVEQLPEKFKAVENSIRYTLKIPFKMKAQENREEPKAIPRQTDESSEEVDLDDL